MESLVGRFPKVLNVLPREKIEGSQKGFSKGEREATSKARQKAKNPRGAGPEGFWPLVWPRMWPRVCLQKILSKMHSVKLIV